VLNDIPLPTVVKVNQSITNHPDEFTCSELEAVTAVFKSLETGLRQGTIFPKDLHRAITRLGLNPTDQEIVDISNYIAKDGLIYFPDFCHFVLGKLREDQPTREAEFHMEMFKILCGTEPLPTNRRAKKYRLRNNFLSRAEFFLIMRNLPELVPDTDIQQMFEYADTDKDGRISFEEFLVMVNPPEPPQT